MLHPLFQGTLRLLDRLGPAPESDDREARRRVRAITAAALIGTVILGTTGVTSLLLGSDGRLAWMNFAWTAAFLLALPIARWRRSPDLLANTLVALGYSHTLILSALAGGRNIGALFGFAVMPLVAVLLSGWRSGLVFTALSVAAVLLTPLSSLQWLTPSDAPGAPVSPALVRDALNVVFAVGLVSALYDFVRSSTLRDAQAARREAEAIGARARQNAERQRTLIEMSRHLHDATIETFDAELGRAMEQAAKLAGANRTVLRLIDGRDYVGRFSYGDDVDGSGIDFSDTDAAIRSYPWTSAIIREGRIAQARRIAELPDEAAPERSYLSDRGVVSWLCVPIRAGRRPIGYQSFETTADEKTWGDEETAALRLMTEILSAAVLRNRTARALRESEQKFAAAFRDHPDAMVITDLATEAILECNERWLKLVGRTRREDVIGRQPWDFEQVDHLDRREQARQELLTTGRTATVELTVGERPDERRTFLVSATRIDIGGRPCALSSVHDWTARKRLEQQLLQAQKLESVGRLAGGIAHDFNNMLTVISGYSASLIAELDGELRADAEQIQQAARRSAELTRQLLAFSRRQVLKTELLDPNEVIEGLQPMLRPLIGESIALAIELSPGVGPVRSDRGQLEQAIVNLVANARDAMPEGGRVQLRTSACAAAIPGDIGEQAWTGPQELAPGAYVVITVSDEGVGIDPELAGHVMEPFYSTKAEGKGTGLGLPMVHGLARQCGGTLVLESEPGRGTRAHIYLPRAEGEPVRTAATAAEVAPAAAAEPRRILVAEDEPNVRRLAARTLRAAGYEVIEVEDGAQALERVVDLREEVDLVLSDVVMPRLSGIELARRLRDWLPTVPVILMSGYPDAGSRPIPDDAGFLLKPFEPARLCEVVASALRDSGKTPHRHR